jgi:hypothetical protein
MLCARLPMCAPITVLIALKAPPKLQTTITDCAAAMPSIQPSDDVKSLAAAQACLAFGAWGAWRLPMWPVELQQSFRACPLRHPTLLREPASVCFSLSGSPAVRVGRMVPLRVHHVPGWFLALSGESFGGRSAGPERLMVQTRLLGLIGILESFGRQDVI